MRMFCYNCHMNQRIISKGAVHALPKDMRSVLLTTPKIYNLWEDITPLARNEWICWVIDAKKMETRERRLKVMVSKMKSGMRRPCCWMGCPHRK
jgi:uncharacterized protein YdeI (YjbR/CyaY-like superfamily)